MKISKLTALIAVLTASSLMLIASSGCGKKNNTDETTTDFSSEETTEAPSDGQTNVEGESTTADNADTTGATEQTTEPGSETEQTTKKENSTVNEDKTVSNETKNNAQTVSIPDKSEFDILKSAKFQIKGTSIDAKGESTPLEIARTDESLYMVSDFDGIEMGALISNGTAYMICPEKKVYLEISDSLKKTMNLDDSQFTDMSSYSFSDLKKLKEADEITQNASFRGASCTSYKFTRENSIITVFMNGTKLLGFTTTNLDGSDATTTVITSITADVPSAKITPPSDYKSYKGVLGAIKFMSAIGKVE